MSITKRRLSHEESRSAALEAARALLVEAGPAAVTLKAVSARMGRTHANLLHHFGSAADLQMALAEHMAKQVCGTIADVVLKARRGEADPRMIVDLAFDAFDREGAGALATWMVVTGNENALNPILNSIRDLLDQLQDGVADGMMQTETLAIVLLAMGDSLLGASMAKALGLPRKAARDVAFKVLMNSPGVAARAALL